MPKKMSTQSPKSATVATEAGARVLELYRQMLLIRRVEEAAAKGYAQGKIGGFLHLGIGQEAVCTGAIAALKPTDYVVGTYREHGHYLAKGGSAQAVLAELYGKAAGASRGLGGSMHLFSAEHRMLGGYGIVGGHVPLATGVAFAAKYRGTDEVTLCFFGDGSVPQGAFHEGLSLAGLWKLPIVFICENNQYSMGTPLSRTLAVSDVTERAAGYGVARDRFDGEDVVLVQERIAIAVERARKTREPTLIEVLTYRFRGHSMSDPGNYRSKDEIEERKKRDPLILARQRLQNDHHYSDEAIAAVDAQVKAEVQAAVQFAETAPEADASQLWNYIYADAATDPKRM